MKFYRILALFLAVVLCAAVFAGCRTSEPSMDEPLPETSWADLLATTQMPETSAGTEMPLLSAPPIDLGDNETEVTNDYKSTFIGTWDGDPSGAVYEFKSNETLTITTGEGLTLYYNYWLIEKNDRVRLCILASGDEKESAFYFTATQTTLTLYDVATGDMADQLARRITKPVSTPTPTRRQEVDYGDDVWDYDEEEDKPTPTPTQTPSPSPSVAPSPSPSVAPSPSPSVAPSPSPSVAPSPSPSVAPSPSPSVEPSPSPSVAPSPSPSVEPSPSPSVVPSPSPSVKPSPSPSVEPTPSPSVKPSPSPSVEPSPSPSAEPSGEPATEPSTVPSTEPTTAPSTEPSTVPSTVPSTEPSASPSAAPSVAPSPSPSVSPSPTPVPEAVEVVMPKVACVLDVVAAGGTFDPADEVSFWNIMTRYVSQRDPDTEEEYIVVTAEQMLQYAMAVYPDVTALPAIPEDITTATYVPADPESGTQAQYKIKVSSLAGLEMTTGNYGDGTFTVTVGSGADAVTYLVVYEDASILSITKQ